MFNLGNELDIHRCAYAFYGTGKKKQIHGYPFLKHGHRKLDSLRFHDKIVLGKGEGNDKYQEGIIIVRCVCLDCRGLIGGIIIEDSFSIFGGYRRTYVLLFFKRWILAF